MSNNNGNENNTNKSKVKRGSRGGGGMGPGGRGGFSGDKAKNSKTALLNLWKYLAKYRIHIVIMVVFSIVSVVFNILGPRMSGKATTEIYEGIMRNITGSSIGIDFSKLSSILITMIGMYVISEGFGFLMGFIMSRIVSNLGYNLRKDVNKKVSRLPLAFFDKVNYGEVLAYITNDINVITNSLNQIVFQFMSSVFTIIGIFIMMLLISWQMSLITLLIIPVSIVVLGQIVRKSQKYFIEQQESISKTNGHIEEMFNSHIIIKTNNGEKQSIERFEEFNKEMKDANESANFLSGLMQPITRFISNLGYVAVCILGAYYAARGVINVGEIQSFIQYVRRFTNPLAQIAQIANVIQESAAASERVFTFLDEKEETPDAENPVPTDDIKGDVYFAHVNFGYTEEKTIINDFSAIVTSGTKVAIVGPTGAGKTTIIKLLMRFYDVNDGAILLDGYDLKQFARDDLRKVFGMVLQDTWLYQNTIRENIRYGRLDATDAEVYAAAKIAYADHFIKTLPDGYDTIINEESSNISQGQKQLLTIARAVIKDPKVLILDEATSSVDTRTEVLIQKAMDNVMKGRTSFIIAHRLSTIKNADVILVMKDGDIVEQGNHENLLEEKGFYYDLYYSQFDTYEEAV